MTGKPEVIPQFLQSRVFGKFETDRVPLTVELSENPVFRERIF